MWFRNLSDLQCKDNYTNQESVSDDDTTEDTSNHEQHSHASADKTDDKSGDKCGDKCDDKCDDKSDDDKSDDDTDDDTDDEDYVSFRERLQDMFFSRLGKLNTRKMEDSDFASEARLHFLFFWLTDKKNWLAELDLDQLDFLRDVLALSRDASQKTNETIVDETTVDETTVDET